MNVLARHTWAGPEPFVLVNARIRGAVGMEAHILERAVRSAYDDIALRLRAGPAPNPVRFWNFIPRLHELVAGRSRYLVFNAGRYAAFSGTPSEQPWDAAGRPRFPTASCVGCDGEDLVVFCLGAAHPGEPHENPRQVPAYRYSAKFGPRPPCFTRATSIAATPGGPRAMLVAGTASIVGEESLHPGDLERQFEETFKNLDALRLAPRAPSPEANTRYAPDSLRVYHPREQDRRSIMQTVSARYPGIEHVETMRADLCRPELLVEIECTIGIGALTAAAGGAGQ